MLSLIRSRKSSRILSLRRPLHRQVSAASHSTIQLMDSGGKCGSALIDTAFKGWVREVLGRDRYAELDPANARQHRLSPHTAETGPMRELIHRFNVKKAAFSNSSQSDIKLDLPAPLSGLSIEDRVKDGELTIHRSGTS